MSSSSKTNSSSDVITNDSRQLVDGKAVAVGKNSDVTINQVPDEAFALSGEVVKALAKVATAKTQQGDGQSFRTAQTLMKYAIPAGLIAFALAWSK